MEGLAREVFIICIGVGILAELVSSATNVAFGKIVTMSTYYGPDAPGSNAVNGIKTGDWYDGSCACTTNQENPWLLLDLEGTFTVTGMQIVNRVDCCPWRLRNIFIEIGPSNVSLAQVHTYPDEVPPVLNITFDMAYTGQFLRIRMEATDYLTICELEVYEIDTPVDGGWTDWGEWSECTATCGSGMKNRSRTCTNPTPLNGGQDCPGSPTETMDCNTQPCPVDGGWTEFSAWSPCSESCQTGITTRSRECTNPAPSNGGNDCEGISSEIEACNTHDCPVDGGWTEFGRWGPCSESCGTGMKSRSRDCTNPSPSNGGSECQGLNTETDSCYITECPVDGGWTEFSTWDPCSKSCGTGVTSRSRECTNPAPCNGGNECQGNSTETADCNTQDCPVDGGWTEFSTWSPCSDSCGTGIKSRSRECTNPVPSNGGNDCQGSSTEIAACNTQDCPVDGRWTEFGMWSPCSESCGIGSKSRSRECTDPSRSNGGSDCPGSSTETTECYIQECPVDGGWTEFSAWSPCSKSCGTGTTSRSRECCNPAPSNGGNECQGNTTETAECNTQECPVDCGWTEFSTWSPCSESCGTGIKSRSRECTNPVPSNGGNVCQGGSTEVAACNTQPCPVHGKWTDFGTWSSCSKPCGTGTKSRSRECTNPSPSNGGNECPGSNTEFAECNTQGCPVDGGWTEFSAWSSCSKSCGPGTTSRSRECTNPAPSNGGNDCPGMDSETAACNTQECPVDGGWTEFGPWGSCSESCGTGIKSRSRECTNPVPSNGGNGCQGSKTEIAACNTQECPVDGKWTDFGTWSSCSRPCGTGTKSRSRECTNPSPSNGGKQCPGSGTEIAECNTHGCPVNGGWTAFSPWSPCSKSCGTGTKSRSRECTKPQPINGGNTCPGARTQSTACNTQKCPVDGGWSTFGTWSPCSQSCGTGVKSRSRECTNPKPRNGGEDCQGFSTQVAACNTQECPATEPECIYLDCSSTSYRYRKCTIPGAKQVRSLKVVQKYSKSECRSGRSYGISGAAFWVNRGCRAKFAVCFKGDICKRSTQLTCSSLTYRIGLLRRGDSDQAVKRCSVPGAHLVTRVSVIKSYSKTSCVDGKTFGKSNGVIWVSGCSAKFSVCYV